MSQLVDVQNLCFGKQCVSLTVVKVSQSVLLYQNHALQLFLRLLYQLPQIPNEAHQQEQSLKSSTH